MFDTGQDRAKKISLSILTIIIGCGIALLQIFADPFGLPSSIDRINSILFSSILAPYYGASEQDLDGFSSVKGRDNIVVLLYDDYYLEREGINWPINPKRQKQLLKKIVDARPQAIFIDLYYVLNSKKRENRVAKLYEFANNINGSQGCEINRGRSTIIFASMLSDVRPISGGISPNCVGLSSMNTDEFQYALSQRVVDDLGKTKNHPTAAYQLYKIWCQNTGCSQLPEKVESQTLFIQWGYAPSTDMYDYYASANINCQTPGTTFFSKLGRSVYIFFVKALNGFSKNWRPNCLYHTHTSMTLVQDLDTTELAKNIENKIVLIGTDLKNHPDFASSTVHGKVPGVFWHAAALDNLIEYGPNFLHEVPTRPSFTAEVFANVFIIMIFVIFRFYLSSFSVSHGAESTYQDWLNRMNYWFGVVMLLFLSMLVACLIYLTHRAPANWIGIAALLFIVNPEPFKSVYRVYWYIFVDESTLVLGRSTVEMTWPKIQHYTMRCAHFLCLVISATSLFLVPTVYFTINPNSTLVVFGLFLGFYLLLFVGALRMFIQEIGFFNSLKKPIPEMECEN